MSGCTCATAAGSRFDSGSSSSSSSGSCRIARATARRCTIPRESSATGSSARRSMPTASSTLSTRSAAVRDRVQARVVAQVLATAQLAVQQRLVAEEADPAADGVPVVGQLSAEHPHRRRRAGAGASRASAAASSCRRRWGRTRRASGPWEVERDVAQRGALAVAAAGAAQADGWFGVRHAGWTLVGAAQRARLGARSALRPRRRAFSGPRLHAAGDPSTRGRSRRGGRSAQNGPPAA